MDNILLVNKSDEVIGYGEKLAVHKSGLLHRAFSVFLFSFDDKRILIQRRAFEKYHSGGLWSNACCSHPRNDKAIIDELKQRLYKEIAYFADIKQISSIGENTTNSFIFCGKFGYHVRIGELIEHEIDSVYVLFTSSFDKDKLLVDPQEVSDVQWITLPELVNWICEKPYEFTAWFLPALNLACKAIFSELKEQNDFEIKEALARIANVLNSAKQNGDMQIFDLE